MITKLEWQEWKSHKVTQKLVKLYEGGIAATVDDLLRGRGTDGDFQRGAIDAYNDAINEILTGAELVEVTEK